MFKKQKKRRLYRRLMFNFSAVFVTFALIFAALFVAFSFSRARNDYETYNEMILANLDARITQYFDAINSSSETVYSNGALWEAVTHPNFFSISNATDIANFRSQLRVLLSNMYYFSSHITSVDVFIPIEKKVYTMDSDVLRASSSFDNHYFPSISPQRWISISSAQPGRYHFIVRDDEVIDIAIALTMPFSSDIAFVYKYSVATTLWEDVIGDSYGEGESVVVMNTGHDTVYFSRPGDEPYLPLIKNVILESGQSSGSLPVPLASDSLVTFSASADWIVVKTISYNALYANISTGVSLYLIIAVAMLALMTVFSARMARSISRPIRALTEGLADLSPSNFHLEAHYFKDDEIGTLYKQTHDIVDMVNDLIRNEYQMRLHEKETRLKIVQLQFNPHFIYNVLQQLSNIAIESGNTEIEEITDAFGLLLRYNLANDNRRVRVMEEVEALKKYFFIIQKSYGKRLNIDISVAEDTLQLAIIPFILQPIVENSFRHGLSRKVGQIHLAISIWQENGTLTLRVQDNGIGADEAAVAEVNSGSSPASLNGDIVGGKGLGLIRNHIELEFGQPYGLHMESLFNIGTTITVTLPAIPYSADPTPNTATEQSPPRSGT